MRITVASGKGGTGKTTVAVGLTVAAARRGLSVVYADCDVEEPNGRIFLKPRIEEDRAVERLVPVVDQQLCTHCGECVKICRFGAIVSMPSETLVFPELCHSCGGCALICPVEAIREEAREIGRLRLGRASDGIRFVEGELTVGEALSPSVVEAVKQALPPTELQIVDAPPGTSCQVVASVNGADFVVLVTEPTPFGLHDLSLAVKLVSSMRLPFGVVINRAGLDDRQVERFCNAHAVPVLARLPDRRDVAEAYSRGELLTDAVPEFAERFERLLDGVLERKAA